MTAYQVLRAPRHETVQMRGLAVHLTRWGPDPSESNPPVFLLHGWQDTGDTFQFLVDNFESDWPLIALDWRGFGRSEWPRDGYWFADYLADLDALLDRFSEHGAARLVGHSMGGNIACLYAGVRPDKVRCIANLEGFGLPRSPPDQTPPLLRQWLDQVRSTPQPKTYDSVEQLASIIRFRYPRLGEAEAGFVAAAWSREIDGRLRLLGDPRHRWVNPNRYHREDAEACWREVKAPVLLLVGEESDYLSRLGADGSDAALRNLIPQLEIVRIAGAGHMLHLEKADAVAPLIESFLKVHSMSDPAWT